MKQEDSVQSLEVGAQAMECLSNMWEAQHLITGTTEIRHSEDGQGNQEFKTSLDYMRLSIKTF